MPPWGVPTAPERGAESEVARKWARWLHDPYRLGGPHRFRARGRIRSGPQVGKVATYPLPPGGSPPLQSRGHNQKWPTSGQRGYIAPAAWGVPTASERGADSEVAHKWARWLNNPCRPRGSPSLQSGGQNQKWPTSGQRGYIAPAAWGVPTASERGADSEVAHKWARWLNNPCRPGGSPSLQSGGHKA